MPYALLVDDDVEQRAARRRILEADGWEVADVDDPGVALAAMRVRRPDVVLLGLFDALLSSPVASGAAGVHLLEEMLLDPHLRSVPRVVISSTGNPVERRFALGLGAAAWLSSPVTTERLLAAAWDHRSDATADDDRDLGRTVGPR